MTDELLYQRLAISIAHLHSPLPRVHGELIGNVNQLYPLLLAPLYGHGLVPDALHDAHILNAFVMSSASIPAFLLTRRVTERRALAYLVAALSVCVPWVALSSFLLTEVVAYPAFLWAVLALQAAAVTPRARNDVLALLGLAIAILARTQFAVLLVALPIALFIHRLAFVEGRYPSRRARVRAAARDFVTRHPILTGAYGALAVAAIALAPAGRLSSVLGTYSVTAEGNLLPDGIGRSLLEHLATVAIGLGILPFVVGVAWLLTALVAPATRERHAFAALATLTITVLVLEVSSYDLRFGNGLVHDRYLFYVAPLILVALAAALSDRRWPYWSLFIPAGLLAVGFSDARLPRFEKLNVDTPVSVLNDRLFDIAGSLRGAHLLLALGTIALTLLFLLGSVLLRRTQLAALLVSFLVVTLPAQTAYAFSRLFAVDGTSGRPITLDQGVVFDWIDRTLGPDANVTMVPYPMVYADFWASVGYAWDVEFWNMSVNHAAVYRGGFSWTPDTFPKTSLQFDPATGRANVSPSGYVAQSVGDARFHIAGKAEAEYRGVLLIHPQKPWRADWMTVGLYDDGWTKPGVVGRIRIFAVPGQTSSVVRYVTLSVKAPGDVAGRTFRAFSNMGEWRDKAVDQTKSNQVRVCVPARGFAEVGVSTKARRQIYGSPESAENFGRAPRQAGIMVTGIALADELGSC